MLRRSGSHRSGCHIASGRTVVHRRRPAGTVHGRGSGDADRGESSTSPSARPANACQRCRRATVSIADEGSRRPAPGPASNVRRLCSTGVLSSWWSPRLCGGGVRHPARATSHAARHGVTDITALRGCERPIFARAPHTPSPCTPRPSPPTSPPPAPTTARATSSTVSPPTSPCACAPVRSPSGRPAWRCSRPSSGPGSSRPRRCGTATGTTSRGSCTTTWSRRPSTSTPASSSTSRAPTARPATRRDATAPSSSTSRCSPTARARPAPSARRSATTRSCTAPSCAACAARAGWGRSCRPTCWRARSTTRAGSRASCTSSRSSPTPRRTSSTRGAPRSSSSSTRRT
ncbi:Uncharacterised protein [Mycobacteroides abscessus]|nr:Uncharacterised protein [Mycobacteroides abscessus]